MSLLPVLDGFTDELEKISARKGLKLIRQFVGSGHIDKAMSIAKSPGVLKPSPMGSTVKMLSKMPTKEGPVMLTAHPDHGLAASKFYHPKGKATTRMVAAKEELGKINHPANTKLLGKAEFTGMPHPVHHFEYVPGQTLDEVSTSFGKKTHPSQRINFTKGVDATISDANESVLDLQRTARSKGLELHDIHANNKMIDRTGQGRLVDSFPVRAGDPDPFRGVHAPIEPRKGFREMMEQARNASDSGELELKRKGPPPKARPPSLDNPLMRPSRR